MADTDEDAILGMIAAGETLPKVIESVGSKDFTHFIPAMRCLGNILTTNDADIIDRVIFEGGYDKLTNILYATSANLTKECLWALSNITAGPARHINKFVESTAFPRVMDLCSSFNIDLRKESLWVLVNAITGGDTPTKEMIFKFNDYKVVDVLTSSLTINEIRLLKNVLEGIEELLKLDHVFGWLKSEASVAFVMEQRGMITALEELQKHPNTEIYDRVVHVMTSYLELDDDGMNDGGQ